MEKTTAEEILAYNKWLDTVENKEQYSAIELLDMFMRERDIALCPEGYGQAAVTAAQAKFSEESEINTCADCEHFLSYGNECSEKTSPMFGGRVIPAMKACDSFQKKQ